MSTDWCLRINNHTGDEIVPPTSLITMMIEREGTMETFSASMILDHEIASRLIHHITSRNFFQLNYFSRSYPEISHILKDALLTSFNYVVNNGESSMHVEASWQYYREIDEYEYNNEINFTGNSSYLDVYEENYILSINNRQNIQYWNNLLLDKKANISNWKSFGF